MKITRPERIEIQEGRIKMPQLPENTLMAVWVFIGEDGTTVSSAGCASQDFSEEDKDGFRQIVKKTVDLLVDGT